MDSWRNWRVEGVWNKYTRCLVVIMTRVSLVCLLIASLDPGLAAAAQFCATTSSELQSALSSAQINGEDDQIRIATGTYTAPSGGFRYHAHINKHDDFDIEISGGWTEFFGNDCGQILVQDPNLTVLNGGGTEQALSIIMPPNANVTVRLLAFINGFSNFLGGGLEIGAEGDYAGQIMVDRNTFIGNQSVFASALSISGEGTAAARIRVRNNLMVANSSQSESSGAGAVSLLFNHVSRSDRGLEQAPAIAFVNNTVMNNSLEAAGPQSYGGVRLAGTGTSKWVVNNILWDNDFADLIVEDTTGYRLWNNNIGYFYGMSPASEENNISVEPVFQDCGLFCVDRIPILDSPVVDAGMASSLWWPWSLADTDLKGRARISGPGVDMGAYENHSRLFSDRFEKSLP